MRAERHSRLHDLILKRLGEARERFGHSFELKHIEGNWGDTTSDPETLADLNRYLETGEFLPSKPLAMVDPRESGKVRQHGGPRQSTAPVHPPRIPPH